MVYWSGGSGKGGMLCGPVGVVCGEVCRSKGLLAYWCFEIVSEQSRCQMQGEIAGLYLSIHIAPHIQIHSNTAVDVKESQYWKA